jgi:hypothetical protein
MVAKRGTKTSTGKKLKSLKVKSISGKQDKAIKGGYPIGPPQYPNGPPNIKI